MMTAPLNRRFLTLAGTLGLTIGIACGVNREFEHHEPGATDHESKRVRVLVYGGDSVFPPFEFLDENSQPTGFNIDLARAVAREIGAEISFLLAPWDEIRSKMENGEIDFASMFYSASRERRLSFSVPHTRMYQAVYVRDDSPEYRSFDVLKGHRISVQNGDIMHDYALEHGLADTLTVTSSLEEALALLAAGQVDYALGSHLQGLHWIRKNGWPHLSAIEGHLIATEYCYAFAKMNTDLRERCNEGLRQVKEKGKYREIYNRWLGVIDLDYSRRWIIQVVLIFLAAAFLLAALAVGSIAVLRHQVRKRTAELEKANAALEESQSKAITLMQDAVLDKEHLQQSLTVAKKSRRALLSVLDDEKRGAVVRARLSAAIEQMAEGVLVTDDGGSIQYVNPAFTTITGYTREEAVGKNPSFLKSGEQDAEFYQRMWRKLIEGDIWRGHFINKRKDGAFYEEEASISPVHDAANKIVNYVAVKRDVTRELHLEAQFAQAQKMESVGRLAGGVAHDFNNLLMGIMGYAELCRGEIPLGHPIREWLDQITHIGQRSAEITRQLLAFASKQTIAPKVLNLNDAVAGMLKLLRQLISEGVTLEWVPGTALRPVKIDPAQVDQILANLCINARDAIDGVGKIILETQNVDIDADFCAEHVEAIPGKYVLLTVSDNGCGMHAETIAKMFEPFFTTKEMGKGTGLGLATVYGIVKQNNGFICANSEPGKGTELQIYLPEVTAEVDKIPVLPAEDVPHGHGETILLVEDDPSLCRICQRFLADLGYHVLSAELPDEALKKVGEHAGAIHLLLTDVIMPGMDGRQLANRISAISHGIKILFMSGYTADVIAERGILEKNVAFIAKPFTRDALARKVSSVLKTLVPRHD